MLRYTPCTRRAGWALSHRIKRQGALLREYSSATDSDDPTWFQQLRAQMLQRGVTHLPEHLTVPHEYKLSQTLTGFIPRDYCHPPGLRNPIVPFGHHLIWFNPSLPTCDLLPDGTDASQSPGGPWVRRMWAGGSIQVKPGDYFDKHRGFAVDTPMAGAEHIKHVRLRGQGDAAKIFVTIERRFARVDTLQQSYKTHHGSLGRASGLRKIQAYFEDQLRSDDPWGSAVLKEERNLVFFKERSPEELEAIKAGQMATIKYLNPPGDPHFSHTLTPNRALLFRFSALTFNAHLIHLDPDYARNVEGHRNLLVHGPLSLTLMLQVMKNHLDAHTKGEQVLESIEYRNLAPLYCDEEMRVCGMEKKTLENGSIYDVWIEGPTGGVAVKGTVYTTKQKSAPVSVSTNVAAGIQESRKVITRGRSRKSDTRAKASRKDDEEQSASRKLNSTSKKARSIKEHGASHPAPTSGPSATLVSDPSVQSEGERFTKPSFTETTSQMSYREADPSLMLAPNRAYHRNRFTRLRNHQFVTLPTQVAPPIRTVQSFVPAKPVLSPRTRHILRRLLRHTSPTGPRRRLPLVRKYAALPYAPDPARTALRRSRFLREGVRRTEKLGIRYQGESLGRWRIRRKMSYYS